MDLMDNAHALIVGIADYQHIRRLPQVQDARERSDSCWSTRSTADTARKT